MQNTIFFHSKEKSNSRAKETTLHQKIENIDEVHSNFFLIYIFVSSTLIPSDMPRVHGRTEWKLKCGK